MSYIVSIRDECGNDGWARWWRNFVNSFPEDNELSLNEMMQGHNGIDVIDTWELQFDSEEDFLVFKLKFS